LRGLQCLLRLFILEVPLMDLLLEKSHLRLVKLSLELRASPSSSKITDLYDLLFTLGDVFSFATD
jgi:hypothetical protein